MNILSRARTAGKQPGRARHEVVVILTAHQEQANDLAFGRTTARKAGIARRQRGNIGTELAMEEITGIGAAKPGHGKIIKRYHR